MPIIKQKEWEECVEANQDPYGKACVDVAREVMRLLDKEASFDPYDIINTADSNIKAGGITGSMAGAVANIVSGAHSRGEEFRIAWNARVGKHTDQENAKGVLNPAVMHIGG